MMNNNSSINLLNKIVIGSGVSKFTYEIDDDYVCVCPQSIHKEKSILTEYDMLIYLQSFKLPIVPNIQLVDIQRSRSGCLIGMLQKNIKMSKLYKPMSIGPILLPRHDNIIQTLLKMYDILSHHKIYITDFQLLYNDSEIYLIDPSNVYHVDLKYHLGHDVKLRHEELSMKYLHQMKCLREVIDYNLGE